MRDEARLRKSDTVWVTWSSLPLRNSLSFESAVLHPSHFLVPVTGPWSPFSWHRHTLGSVGLTRPVVWISTMVPPKGLQRGNLDMTFAFHSVSTS